MRLLKYPQIASGVLGDCLRRIPDMLQIGPVGRFPTDPEVVDKILRHLGLPLSPPALTPARSSSHSLGLALPGMGGASIGDKVDAVEDSGELEQLEPVIRRAREGGPPP